MSGSFDVLETAEALKTVISDSIAAKVAAINTAKGDSITIVVPADYRFAPIDQPKGNPSLTIVVGDATRIETYDDYTMFQQGATLALRAAGSDGTASGETPASLTPQEVNFYKASRMMKGMKEILELNRTLTLSGVDNADTLVVDGVTFIGVDDVDDDLPDLFEIVAIMDITVAISGTA